MTRIHRQDALRYLKIHPQQLSAWEQKGLIPRQDSYTLEEYGQLRTLRDLSVDLTSASISAAVGAMRSVAGMANPLLDAHPVVYGSRVHFRHQGSVTEPISRQLIFDFETGQRRRENSSSQDLHGPIEMDRSGRESRISEMFLEAIRYEDAGRVEEAGRMYEQILGFDPIHAPACINLGTICYNRRQFTRAESLYRRATEADPHYALAFFDLGNVLDELKRLREAIAAYESAIRLIPAYADAHYNLALAYERTGERRMALRHWTAYLKLDANSRWAVHARGQVRKILDREKLSIVRPSPLAAMPQNVQTDTSLSTAVPTAG